VSNYNSGKQKRLGHTRCGRTTFHWGRRTYIIGIINLSPDSFAGDGLGSVEPAVDRAKRMTAEGADIIDVGGESTRPGSTPISVDEELSRVIPVLERLTREISVPLSIDTYKLEVAREALDAGVNMINDIWGLKKEPKLAALAAQREAPLIGTSRKSVIGRVLGLPSDQRLEGTAATVAIGIAKGADIVRVHDVKEVARVCKMSDAIIRG